MDNQKIRMLIVDDEKIQRDGIRFLIDHADMGIEVSECENGEEAYHFLKKNSTDILLTDIRMPFMDGLELASRALHMDAAIKIIIYSGYEEFEYARTAMSLGIHHYIRKPVDLEEFKQVITSVTAEVKENEKKQEEDKRMLSYVRTHVLFRVLNNLQTEDLMNLAATLFGKNWTQQYKRVFLIHFEKEFFEDRQQDFENVLRQSLRGVYEYINLDTHQGAILWNKQNSQRDFNYMASAQRLQRRLEEEFKQECWIIVSGEMKDLYHIANEMADMQAILENRFWGQGSRVIFRNETGQESDGEKYTDGQILKDIRQLAGEKDYVNLRETIKKYGRDLRRNGSSLIYSRFIFAGILYEIMQYASIFSEDQIMAAIEKIYKSSQLDEVIGMIEEIIVRTEAFQSECDISGQHRAVEIVKKYICRHYGEVLDLECLAEISDTTPRYLCMIFKKETGGGLNRYIREYRMQRAREFLESTNMKIKDICEKTGYHNVSYFCQSFREYFGVSPEKFRNRS